MMVLDSSFLVSLFLPDDINNEKALGLFEKHRADEMLLTDMVLFETLTVLARKRGTLFARGAYHDLASNRKLLITYLKESDRKEILENFLSQDGRLSVEDISVIYSCKLALANPLCFGKELLKQIRK